MSTGFRLAGTINHKRGAWSQVVQADLTLAPYGLDELVGDLPEPVSATRRPRERRDGEHSDPLKRIPPPEYFRRLAGISVPRGGLVRCPVPGHDDTHPSCSVGRGAGEGWCCHAASCGARGAIYDLASVLLGGPWGPALRGDAFKRAQRHVAAVFTDHAPACSPPDAGPMAHAGPGDPASADPPLWRVRVREDVDARIAGHGGSAYLSPPQPRADALTLAGLLLGQPIDSTDASERWTRPIAGGRRTVTVESAGGPAEPLPPVETT